MTATATATATKPATKAGASPRHTACVCPVCGAEAGYDLAPNPGPPKGGEHAPPPPPPPEIVTPPPEPPPMPGQWYMVICSTGVHRTLWPENRLEELAAPVEPPPEARKSHAPAAEHGHGQDRK
jgi:hypothetical protein